MPLVKRTISIIGLGIIIGTSKNALSWFIYFIQGATTDRFPWSFESLGVFYSKVTLFYYMESIIIAWVMLIVFFVLELYKNFKKKTLEAAELESQLAKAQLESLRMQLQPHFLFNAHNTVSMLIRTKQYEQATEMISKISDLLRQSLKSEEGQFVTLGRELEIIKDYLEIEQIRFEDHLTVSFDLDEALEDCLVPHLLLQPIIENAFKHGISKSLGNSELIISSMPIASGIRLSAYNSGPGLTKDWKMEQQDGIGLSNTAQRLARLYPDCSFKFEIFNDSDGVKVQIDLPLKEDYIA